MLQTLDTIIAFAVIMTVVSLMITLLVQMVSAAFSLRGKNLANALSLTFQTIDPKLGAHARALADRILNDPILSDSLFTKKERRPIPGNLLPRYSAERALQIFSKANAAFRIAKDSTDPTTVAAARAALGQAEGNVAAAVGSLGAAAQSAWKKLAVAQATLHAAAVNDANWSANQQAASNAEQALEQALPALPAPASTADTKPGRLTSWLQKTGQRNEWSFWHLRGAMSLATAVRPGEVYRILHDLRDLTKTEAHINGIPPELIAKAGDVLRAVGVPDDVTQEAREKLTTVARLADVFTTDEQKKAILESVSNLGSTVDRAATQAYDRFQRWFGSAQDRAEQWFQVHMRAVTIVLSIPAAFLLQLDTIEIFRLLRTKPVLTQALVNSTAPAVLETGAGVLDSANTPAREVYLSWREKHPLYPLVALPTPGTRDAYKLAINKRLGEEPDFGPVLSEFRGLLRDYENKGTTTPAASAPTAPASTASSAAPVRTALQEAYKAWAAKYPNYVLPQEPAAADNPDDVLKKLTEHLKTKSIAERGADDTEKGRVRAEWLADYDALYADGTMAAVRRNQKTYQELQKKVAEAGFDIVPTPFLGRWDKEPLPTWARVGQAHWWQPNWKAHPRRAIFTRHLLGMLITAGLLTLGAPFWFNLLKNLMNLRPAVATLIERRPQSAPALPHEPPEPRPPS